DRIHQVNERLKDLLSDVISSMKSQIGFLTPVIAGIVVGISAMIVTILSRLSSLLGASESEQVGEIGFTGGLTGLAGLFEIANIIPSYYLQLIIGIYVVQVIIILTLLANGIENGNDNLSGKYRVSKNLYTSGIIYFLVALIVTLVFTVLANVIQVV
ncbi:hypothetical protein K8R47_01140, partial [archaeon]|nr:hypothetical protein [archaeon]